MELNNDFNDLNNSQEDSNIMNKINEEAEKIDNNIDNASLNYLNKYINLSINELQKEIIQKNENLISLHEEKEQSKNKLNDIVKSLNELVVKNSELLYQKEQDPYLLQQLERVVELRKRDLTSSKKINNTFKLQYKSMSERIENLLSPEKIETFEGEIDSLRKENSDINSKIKILKDNNLENAKKIEGLKDNKKFNNKIKSYSEEIKSLGNKKHEYFTKINLNKRSLDNVIREKDVLLKLYNANINEDSDEIIVSKINFWLDLIKSDLEGNQDEIIEKAETDNSKVIKEIDKRVSKNNNKNPLYLPSLNINNNIERARSSSNEKREINNNINNINISQNIHKGIFSKYSILKERTKTKNLPRYMQYKTEDNKIGDINNDYENTNDNDYRELLNKKNEYVNMINRLEETIKEVQKTSSRKNKSVFNTVNDNSKKLSSLKQQNSLIKIEIEELEKILLLCQEEVRIKKEIKNNENKINKNNHPDVTANIILNDLSNINEDDERKKSIYQINNIDLKDSKNDITLEYNESNKKIIFPTDISKVEKIDEEEIPEFKSNRNLSREQRLEEIKVKYLEMDEDNEEKVEENNKDKVEENKEEEKDENIKDKIEENNEKEKEQNNEKEKEENNEKEKEENNEEKKEENNEEKKEKNNEEEKEENNEEEKENNNEEEKEENNEEEDI